MNSKISSKLFDDLAARKAYLDSLPPVEDRKRLREQMRVSVAELARRCQCTRYLISRFERGEAIPTGRTLVLLSEFFDVAEGRYTVA
jgi:predicted transcriptional regulator